MRTRLAIAGMLTAWLGAMTLAQGQKITTPEEYDKVMKTIGPAMQAAAKAAASGAYGDASKQVAIARAALGEARGFWAVHKVAEAEKMAADAVAKADALEKALSAATVDPAAVKAAQTELQGACRTCHTAYRVQNPESKGYAIKPGVIK